MSYTPTNWQTGDTITAAGLNKMEQGIASAGGGFPAPVFVSDSQDNLTCNMTYAEVEAAVATGQCVYAFAFGESVYVLGEYFPNNYVTFSRITIGGGVYSETITYEQDGTISITSNGYPD